MKTLNFPEVADRNPGGFRALFSNRTGAERRTHKKENTKMSKAMMMLAAIAAAAQSSPTVTGREVIKHCDLEPLVGMSMSRISPTPRTYGEWLASRKRQKRKGWQKARKA